MLYLYPKNTVDFTNNGDPIRYSFDEHVVRDEGFYLTFNLLLDKEEAYKKIKKEMIVSADTPDGINQFRIYDIKNKSTSVEVTAVQLMYDFDNKEVNPFSLKNATGSQVISRFKSSFKSTLGQFTMDSSIAETHDFATNDEDDDTPSHNALEVLNRITDRWDSELMLNGFDIRMIKRLGAKTDALLYEKKNISEFEDASSVSGMATRIHATSKFTPEGKEDEVTLSVTVDSPLINEYAQIYEKSYVNNDAKTEAELIAWVKLKYSTENTDKPSRSITVSTNIIDGTEINYGDDLVLKYLVHDVDEIIRCVGYDYDPIKNTYYSVTLGDWKDSFATTLTGGIVDKTNQQLNQIKNNITYISMSANGKNRNAYGPEPVPNPINGDNWYYYEFDRPNDVELRIFQDGFWVGIDFATKKEVDEVIEQADLDRAKIEQDFEATKQLAKQYTDAEVLKFDTKFTAETGAIRNEVQTGYTNAVTAGKAYTDTKSNEFNTALGLVKTDVANTVLKADSAVLKADKAISDAGFAKVDADTAKQNALTAIGTANTAKTNAETALSTANTAITNSVTALSTAQTAISNSGTAITNAQNALNAYNNLEIGGRNLLVNTGNADIGDIAVGKNIAQKSSALKFERTVAGQKYITTGLGAERYYRFTNTAHGNLENILDGYIQAGKTYTFSGQIRTSLDTDIAPKIRIQTGITSWTKEYSYQLSKSEEWTSFLYSVTVDENAKSFYISFQSYGNVVGSYFETRCLKLEKGTKATDWSPAPEDVQVQITDINGELARKVSQTTFDTLNGTVTNQGTLISQSQTAIGLKADKTLVDTINQTVTKHTTDIKLANDGLLLKSDKSVVDALNGTVATHTNQIKTNADGLALKADKSLVDTVKGTVDKHTLDIKANADGLLLKASSSLVDTIKGTVDNHTTELGIQAQAITARLTSTQVDSLVASKNYVNQAQLTATATQWNLALTQVSNDLSNLEIGGTNLLLNTKTLGQGIIIGGSKNGEYKGLTIAKSIKTTSASYSDTVTLRTNGIPTETTYTISFYARANINTSIGNHFYNPNTTTSSLTSQGNKSTSSDGGAIISITTEWKRYWITWTQTIPTTVKSIIVGRNNHGAIGTEVEIAGIKLEKGTKATDWTPAPEDQATKVEFSELNQTVNSIGGRVGNSEGQIAALILQANGLQTTVADKADKTQVTQLSNQWTQTTELVTGHTTQISSLGQQLTFKVTKGDVTGQINIEAGVTLIQNKKLLLDADTYIMGTTFANDIKAKSLESVYADIATLRTKFLIADLITSAYLKVDNALVDKMTATTSIVDRFFSKTAVIDNIETKSLAAVYADILTIRNKVLITDSVTAGMVKADAGLFDKVFINDAVVQKLTANSSFINSVKAIDITADKVTGGLFNGANMNMININVSSLVGNISNFVQSYWNQSNTSVSINASGLVSQSGALNTTLNAGSLTTVSGVKSGTVNALGMQISDSSNGWTTRLYSDGLEFKWYDVIRGITQTSEGLQIKPTTGSGSRLNSALELVTGSGNDKIAYLQLGIPDANSNARLQLAGNVLSLRHPNGGQLTISNYAFDEAQGLIRSGTFRTSPTDGAYLEMVGKQIQTVREGNNNVYIMPSGTGGVTIGSGGSTRWPITALRFIESSNRASKTNIREYNESGLAAINSLTVTTYNRVDELARGNTQRDIGFIAEDSSIIRYDQPDGTPGVDNYQLSAYLVKSVQELDQKVISIANVADASNALANQALSETQKMKQEIQELKQKIQQLESAA